MAAACCSLCPRGDSLAGRRAFQRSVSKQGSVSKLCILPRAPLTNSGNDQKRWCCTVGGRETNASLRLLQPAVHLEQPCLYFPQTQAEAETNVSLRVLPVEGSGGESFEVQARGELQLGLLIGGRHGQRWSGPSVLPLPKGVGG